MSADRPQRRPRARPALISEVVSQVVGKTEGQGSSERKRGALTVRVFAAFEQLGPPFTTHAEPTFYRTGVLSLLVDDPTWMTELTFLKAELLTRINHLVGKETVKELRMRHGKLSRIKKKVPQKAEPPVLTADAVRRIEEWADEIRDPEVKEAMRRAARWIVGKRG